MCEGDLETFQQTVCFCAVVDLEILRGSLGLINWTPCFEDQEKGCS